MSQCLYTKSSTLLCLSARRIPSIIDAWLSASEKMATFSSFKGLSLAAKREAMLPSVTIVAILAENPVGQRRQSYRTRMDSVSRFKVQNKLSV